MWAVYIPESKKSVPVPDHVVPKLRLRKLWSILGWLLVALIIYLSLMPEPVPFPGKFGDKLQHMLAYSVLMAWFANLYSTRGLRSVYACGFVALSVALEFAQQWAGYRHFDVADMAANAAGVAAGWLLAPPRVPGFLQVAEAVIEAVARR